MIRTLTLAALVAALAVSMAHAQVTATQGTATQGTATQGTALQGNATPSVVNDALFAAAAAAGGLTEVSLSELGVQKATDPELKQFSQRMVNEHTRMNSELTALAAQKQFAIPRTLDFRAQFCSQSLAGLTGQEFDRCYAKAQLIVHMDSVAMFEAEAERGQDAETKALASKVLPQIKEHLKMIKPIAQRYEQEKPSTAGAASELRAR